MAKGMGCHFMVKLHKNMDSALLVNGPYCFLSLHVLLKQATTSKRPMWQRTESGLWPTAS